MPLKEEATHICIKSIQKRRNDMNMKGKVKRRRMRNRSRKKSFLRRGIRKENTGEERHKKRRQEIRAVLNKI